MRRRTIASCALACALATGVGARAVPPGPVLAPGTTTRISVRADGSQAVGLGVPYQGDVDQVSISGNGRYVVFYSSLDVAAPQCRVQGTYLRDLTTGRLELVSAPARGCRPGDHGASGGDSNTSITPDGRYVAFTSGARDLLAGRLLPEHSPTGNTTLHVFVRDRVRGRTVLASVGYDGRPANGDAVQPTISADGRYVAFESPATNLVRGDTGNPDEGLLSDVFVRDLRRGVTVRAGPDIRRAGRGPKWNPSISGNGRYVAFETDDGYLAPHKGTGELVPFEAHSPVWVWDRVTGRTELVSRSDSGYAASAMSMLGGDVGSKVSHDGRWITYASQATNLTGPPGSPLQDAWQIYLFDRVNKKTIRVTDGLAGEGGNGESFHPCISPNGRYVSFASASSNLGDVDATPAYYYAALTDVGTDIYLWDRVTRHTRLVSRSTAGLPGDGNSLHSCPSDDGKTVAFTSIATNLVPGDTNGLRDLFVRKFAAP